MRTVPLQFTTRTEAVALGRERATLPLSALSCRAADVICHRHSVTVSACRWATFHSPSSRRYTWVARKV